MFSMSDGKTDAFKYRFADNYNNFNEITDYIHRNPENIHTNVHKNSFGFDRDISVPEISSKIFNLDKNQLVKHRNSYYDLIIQNSLSDDYLYIALEGLNYHYDPATGNLYNKVPIETKINNDLSRLNELTPIAKKIEIFMDEKGKKRIDEYGKYLYDLPSDFEVFKTATNKEILFIRGENPFDTLKNFLDNYDNYDYIQTRDIGYNTVDQILGKQADDNYLKLLRTVSESSNNKELRKYINDKENSYKAFRRMVADSKKQTVINKNNIEIEYIKHIKSSYNSILDTYIQKIAKIRATSFDLSLKSISARIPAQAMQSFMGMDTVGFIDGDANDAYVSH